MATDNVINRTELADRLDNDFDLFIELANLFFEDSKTLLDRIKKSIDENDADSLRKSAHTLKGAVSNFSAISAYDAAYELELAGKENRIDESVQLYVNLENEIDKAILEMNELITRGSF